MKTKLFLIALTLCFGLITTLSAQDLMTHDFNDGTLGPFESGNLNRMTFVNGTLECTWAPEDYTGSGTNSKKTEFRAEDNAYQFRQEFWTGFRIKIHDDYMKDNTNTDAGLMQIWGFDEAAGGANHYAMFKFDGRNGGALVWYHRYGGGSAGKSTYLVYPNFPREQFVDIIIRVKLSSNGGIVQIWADGDLKLNLSNQYMGWGEMDANGQINQSYSTPGSWGMYNYRNVGGTDQAYDENNHYYDGYLPGERRTVTYDDLTLWNGPNGYDIVNPDDGGSTGPFVPDPNKVYYIDSPHHNVRLAANGESQDAYTTSTSTTGADVEWQFVAKGNGAWHLQRAAGGTRPRLRTDNSTNADMQETSYSGSYTYYDITTGYLPNSYFLTLRDGPASFRRLQVDNNQNVRMVEATRSLTWESFTITEASGGSSGGGNFQLVKRNATGFAIDGGSTNSGIGGRSVELYTYVNHPNLTWTEISRGGGYYSYEKLNSGYCMDGGSGGSNGQDVTLQPCSASDQGQQWQKINAGNGHYRLQKRGTNYSLDGGRNGDIDQNVYLWTSSANNQNQHWRFDSGSASLKASVVYQETEGLATGIAVFPNPVKGTLTVNNAANSMLYVYDMAGRLVHSEAIKGESETLELSELPSGIYPAEIVGPDNSSPFKLVKE